MKTKEINPPVEQLETQIKTLAQNFTYPATPDLVSEFKAQAQQKPADHPSAFRFMWAAAIALVIALMLLSSSPARTLMLEALQLGPIRIFLIEPYQATITPTATATDAAAISSPTRHNPGVAVTNPEPLATPIVAISNLSSPQPALPARTDPIKPVFFQPAPNHLHISDKVNY